MLNEDDTLSLLRTPPASCPEVGRGYFDRLLTGWVKMPEPVGALRRLKDRTVQYNQSTLHHRFIDAQSPLFLRSAFFAFFNRMVIPAVLFQGVIAMSWGGKRLGIRSLL